ncbi:hypothetical protein [Streptomyces sp. NRRL F-2580]|uniref:hypothetical protein n=1 Tax=Streptomyces sp. NRRL F-2580 TaxID=1463841 RepID=UPI0004C6B4EE
MTERFFEPGPHRRGVPRQSDSIRANIAYGIPDATGTQVREAARLARADEFIDRLPDGAPGRHLGHHRTAHLPAVGGRPGADRVRLSTDVLDRTDKFVPPGTSLSTRDAGDVPPALSDPLLRRRPRA